MSTRNEKRIEFGRRDDASELREELSDETLAAGVAVDGWRALAALGLALYAVPSPGDVAAATGRQQSDGGT